MTLSRIHSLMADCNVCLSHARGLMRPILFLEFVRDAIDSNQSLRGIYITSGYGLQIYGLHFLKLDQEFFCLLPSLARLYSAAASPSSDGSLAIIGADNKQRTAQRKCCKYTQDL